MWDIAEYHENCRGFPSGDNGGEDTSASGAFGVLLLPFELPFDNDGERVIDTCSALTLPIIRSC